jgi:hypothetical protein
MTAERPASRLPWLVGVTGARATPRAAAIPRGLVDAGKDVDPVPSGAARLSLLDETGTPCGTATGTPMSRPGSAATPPGCGLVPRVHGGHPFQRFHRPKGMIVVPVTTASIAGIATGTSTEPPAARGRCDPHAAAAPGAGGADTPLCLPTWLRSPAVPRLYAGRPTSTSSPIAWRPRAGSV